MTKRDKLLKANPELKNKEINARITAEHPDGDEFAIIRKEIHHLEQVLYISPTQEFEAYYAEAERKKAEVKALMNL